MLKFLSTRHVLMVSLAINVGLLWRFSYEGEGSDQYRLYRSSKQPNVQRRTNVVRSSPSTGLTSLDRMKPQDIEELVISLDFGDPTMYTRFWQQMGNKTEIVILGDEHLSSFSNIKNLCWFLEPKLASAITRLHQLVGNSVVNDRHIVVGTGSSQLYQAALYALSPLDASEPMSVVAAAPYCSSYPEMTDFLKSGLYKWDGDAHAFNKSRPYIEVVTSPNNPDGFTREPVVNQKEGTVVHDLAYYWPQYTPITSPADHEFMLFTVSKATGHAGTRIGWALVKDEEVAKKMVKYMELNSFGVSKESQLRVAKILQAVVDSYNHSGVPEEGETLFEYGFNLMAQRWKKLRAVVKQNPIFSLPDYSRGLCSFSGRTFEPQPAFAWLKCEGEVEDCESFLRSHKMVTRGGKKFGVSPKYARISMMDKDNIFDLCIERLSTIRP